METKKPNNIIDLNERRYFKKIGIPFPDLENTPIEKLMKEARESEVNLEEYMERMLDFIENLKKIYREEL